MEIAIQILHVLVCVFLVLTILLQAGKGAGIGAAFGGGGGQTVFGGRGAQTFLSKLTTGAAAIFFLTSLILSYAGSIEGRSVVAGEHAPPAAVVEEAAPAADATDATDAAAVEGAAAPADAAPAVEVEAVPAEAPPAAE